MTRLVYYLAPLLLLVFLVVLRSETQVQRESGVREVGSSTKAQRSSFHATTTSIQPGELPGYTGWARPSTSLAGSVQVQSIENQDGTVVVALEAPSSNILFDARAYGPSVLPGLIEALGNGTYSVTFVAHDPGLYYLEIVVAFSNPPDLESLPGKNEPAYEGYLVPGFPMAVPINPLSSARLSTDRRCRLGDLIDHTPTSALDKGRWLVRRRNVAQNYTEGEAIRLPSYQSGLQSLGIQMEYVPNTCRLPSVQRLRRLVAEETQSKPVHVVFIGDSNMREQRETFLEMHGGSIQTTLIQTNGGLMATLPSIQTQLDRLAKEDSDFFVLFNAGLHDIDKMCVAHRIAEREPYISLPDRKFSCTQHYSDVVLPQFVTMVRQFPARLLVWESTTAGWPKWGNYGVAWPANKGQGFPMAPQSCLYFNTMAWEIVQSHRIPVLDAYWLTVARPDHRQSSADNSIGKHLVHAGPEVYDSLMRQWSTLILDNLQRRS